MSSFFYLDKTKHKIYHFIVSLDGREVGTITVNKFETEDKLIYKSASETPFYPVFTSSKARIVLDKKYNLESFSDEDRGNSITDSLFIENDINKLSFITISGSSFSTLNAMPVKAGTFIFEEWSPVTYLPVIENYDFKRGRSQGFRAVTYFYSMLPPVKRFITVTSIRDEYIEIDSHRVKAECMLIKTRNYPQVTLWVGKTDRSILMIELPDKKLKITRVLKPVKLNAPNYAPANEAYTSKSVSFKSDNVQLEGTLTVPNKGGAFPGILLLGGDGPEDREYQGLFTSMADNFSKDGFVVLRYDRRGIGSSAGNSAASTDSDEVKDSLAALDFLKSQKEVAPDDLTIIAHSKGTFYASTIINTRADIRSAVFMAPVSTVVTKDLTDPISLKAISDKLNWNEEYLNLAIRSGKERFDLIKAGDRRWVSLLGKRCFMDKMREELDEDPVAEAKLINIPVLIIEGKEEGTAASGSASIIDRAIASSGNTAHTLTYFSYLGRFLGKLVNDGTCKIHYEIDSGVMDAIRNWFKSRPAAI
jgi:pimeloyl-ACP methyl ester carboxylesterase